MLLIIYLGKTTRTTLRWKSIVGYYLPVDCFERLSNLQVLTANHNHITSLQVFNFITKIHCMYLSALGVISNKLNLQPLAGE